MLLISRTLSKLAVSAYLVCVLMVVICGTAVRCFNLYNQCSSQKIGVDPSGRVYAGHKDQDIVYQNFRTKSQDFTLKQTIFAEGARRFLCCSKTWKLVGWKKNLDSERCMFYEEMSPNGYTRYRSVADEKRYISFNKRGRCMKDKKPSSPTSKPTKKCFYFLKLRTNADPEYNIDQHNQKNNPNNNSLLFNFTRSDNKRIHSYSQPKTISKLLKLSEPKLKITESKLTISEIPKIRHHHHKQNLEIT